MKVDKKAASQGSKVWRGRLACIAAFIVVAPAVAQDGPWYLAPEASYFYPDQKAFQDADASLGIAVGRTLGDSLRFELDYYVLRLIPESPGIVDQQSAQINGYWHPLPSGRISPYVGLGLGASHTEYRGNTTTLPFGTLAIGYSNRLSDSGRWQIDTELRARYSYDDDKLFGRSDLLDGQALVRLRFAFGSRPAPIVGSAPAPVRQPASDACGSTLLCGSEQPDKDGDSVPDQRDRCPNTIPNVNVDQDGCMVGQ